ncbi:ABC-2 type transport system ATP-binding protein [Deinococcus metalli]|uniref:ABC-2 type transport system ATP-binding protein n=1 Tax=Deinococcus metalli TaxID=1141878 RepID=A0A7W8NSC8_9DEIO|nr:ABC transporter ATP-binding protein [Deinococcus metalli]MBB5378815.1 ABC-2 type transport system ATP-binding protein [Deinococcus metalli]GHF60561.1 copper ABC transporter ATP-binding protein [Deinococcus metalli]
MTALQVAGLVARHGRRTVLRGADLQVPQGSITALLGQNGSGKSTLMRSVLGLHPRQGGTVRVLDLPENVTGPQVRGRVTYVPTGGAVMPQETARTHFEFGRRIYPRWSLERALESAADLHVPLDQRAGRLSTGQRMGLALAYALGSSTELLLLDEPTNGLDPDHRRRLAQLLVAYASNGNSVLLSSHVLPEVEGLADRGAFLRGGRIILEADLDDLRAQHTIVQAILPDVLPAGAIQRLRAVPGVQDCEVQGRTLTVQVQGEPGALLAALADLKPVDVQSKPQPLADAYADLLGGAA